MTTDEGRTARPRTRQLAPWQAFCLQASVVVFFLAGASAPTPLYATYQRQWHFSPITTTVIFGVYAVVRVSWTVPAQAHAPLVRAAAVVVAVWALAGFYGSLGPALVHRVIPGQGALLGGLALSTLTACGALTVLVLRNAPPRTTMRVGALALIVGVGATLVSVTLGAAGLFFVGTAIAGVGFGAGFQGGIRTVVPLAEPQQRSGLLSVMYLISYLGFGLPTIITGLLVVYGGGVERAAYEYGAAVMLLASLAFAGTLGRWSGRIPASQEVPSATPSGPAVDVCADACRAGSAPQSLSSSRRRLPAHTKDERR